MLNCFLILEISLYRKGSPTDLFSKDYFVEIVYILKLEEDSLITYDFQGITNKKARDPTSIGSAIKMLCTHCTSP